MFTYLYLFFYFALLFFYYINCVLIMDQQKLHYTIVASTLCIASGRLQDCLLSLDSPPISEAMLDSSNSYSVVVVVVVANILK